MYDYNENQAERAVMRHLNRADGEWVHRYDLKSKVGALIARSYRLTPALSKLQAEGLIESREYTTKFNTKYTEYRRVEESEF